MAATFLTNQFLIAMPGMADPNFAQTVTLVCEHNAQGALGIVINRQLPMTLGDVFAQLGLDAAQSKVADSPVLQGGPVQTDRGFVLHTPLEGFESSMPVSDEIMVTTSRDILTAIAQGKGPSKYLVALGYAGWGGGQLEGEMRQNAWLAVEADSNIVFDMPLPNRFDGALGRLGIKFDRLHLEGGHA